MTCAIASAQEGIFAVQPGPEGTVEFQGQEGHPPQPLFKDAAPAPVPERSSVPGKVNPCVQKLRSGGLSGPELNPYQYIQLRDEPAIGNHRCAESYRQKSCEEVCLALSLFFAYYGHFKGADDFNMMRWVVRRASGCFV